jgi:biopolymer transport protein ExbD
MKQIFALAALALATSVPLPAQNGPVTALSGSGLIDLFQWQDYPDGTSPLFKHGQGTSLTVVYNGTGPLQSTLRTIGPAIVSRITTKHYAIIGKLKYSNVATGSYLEMWSYFAPEQPGGPEGAYFSRTLADAGPMAKLEGTDDGRDFTLPFDATGAKTPLVRLVMNVHLGGSGRLEFNDVKLVQYPDAASAAAGQAPASPLPPAVILNVAPDGTCSIRGINYPSVVDALRVFKLDASHPPLVIRPSPDVPYDTIRSVLDACRDAGIVGISFATAKDSSPAPYPGPNPLAEDDTVGITMNAGTVSYSLAGMGNVPLDDIRRMLRAPGVAGSTLTFSVVAEKEVPQPAIQALLDAFHDAGINAKVRLVPSPPPLPNPSRASTLMRIDGGSFLLGILSTCLLLAALAGLKIALRHWRQFRHAREMRRIASLDT